jgi:hypothetical protein
MAVGNRIVREWRGLRQLYLGFNTEADCCMTNANNWPTLGYATVPLKYFRTLANVNVMSAMNYRPRWPGKALLYLLSTPSGKAIPDRGKLALFTTKQTCGNLSAV